MKQHNSKHFGFTLVEMSIVLVIIGIIVGGVLVAQDLSSSARIRSTLAQIQQLNAAVNTFRGKYDQLPGDLPVSKNVAFFGGTTASPTIPLHGLPEFLGNGRINSQTNPLTGYIIGTRGMRGESRDFWAHLSASYLLEENYITPNISIPQPGSHYPVTRMDKGAIVAVSSEDKNYWLFVGNNTSVSDWDMGVASGMKPEEAFGLDTKMDDGFANLGTTFHLLDFDGNGLAGSDSNGTGTLIRTTAPTPNISCWASTPATDEQSVEYALTVNENSCHLIMIMQ